MTSYYEIEAARKAAIKALTVGDEVGVDGRYESDQRIGKVVKITPSGRIDVVLREGADPIRFNSEGREMGAGWNPLRLLDAEKIREAVEAKAARRALSRQHKNFVEQVAGVVRGNTNGFGEVFAMTQEQKDELLAALNALPVKAAE